MAGITFGGKTEKYQTKVPAEAGYSYNYAPTPNGVYAENKTNLKGSGGTTAPAVTPAKTPAVSGNSAGTNTSAAKENRVTFISAEPSTAPAPVVAAPAPAGPTAQQQAETALADLRNKYSAQLRSQYDYAADKMKAERDEALRENWILQQQEEAALPEQLAARGMNGGASETTLANLRARYQGNRNDIRGNYMEEMGDLAQNHNQQQADANRGYSEQWLDYLLSLAKMDEQYKKDLALKSVK